MPAFGSIAQNPIAAASLSTEYRLTASNGTLSLAGQSAVLTPSIVPAETTLSLTGQSSTLSLFALLERASLQLSGQAAPLAPEVEASAAASASLTGQTSSFSLLHAAEHCGLVLSGSVVLTPEIEAAAPATLTLTGQHVYLDLIIGPGGGTEKRVKHKKVKLRHRTIEIGEGPEKRRVGYIDRFAPPPPPPPLELVPSWLFAERKPEAIEPIEFPALGYSDPLALKAEIEAAEDERDAMEAIQAISEMVGDPAMAELNAILAELSQ